MIRLTEIDKTTKLNEGDRRRIKEWVSETAKLKYKTGEDRRLAKYNLNREGIKMYNDFASMY